MVTLDHLGAPRGTDIPASVEAVGTTLHGLLANSPDVNPIELCFAKLKAILRAARPRAFDAVCDAVAASLGGFLAIECTHDVRHCG